jgi:hypothetical protein
MTTLSRKISWYFPQSVILFENDAFRNNHIYSCELLLTFINIAFHIFQSSLNKN